MKQHIEQMVEASVRRALEKNEIPVKQSKEDLVIEHIEQVVEASVRRALLEHEIENLLLQF